MSLPINMSESSARCPNSIHDDTIDAVIDRLTSTGRYETIWRNVVYNNRGLNGEIDVYAKVRDADIFHFYEIKSNDSRKLKKKAYSQYNRYCDAYPNIDTRGIYVNPDRKEKTDYLHAFRIIPRY